FLYVEYSVTIVIYSLSLHDALPIFDTMVSHMENHHDDFVLILAGYSEEMETFLALNPGLESRFPFILNFRDFTIDQLLKIAKQIDRKSTRLNSSHVSISYAVFCFKK